MPDITLGELLSETGGSVKTGPFGTTLKAAEYSKVGSPVISVGEVGYGFVQLHERTPRVPETVIERLPEYVLRSGDIVFGRKGAVDRSAWLRAHEDGYFLGSDGIRVRVGRGADSRFIAYQLQSQSVREWLIQHAAGTTMASLNQPTLERVPLRVPPLKEQQAIAEVLGALDDKIAANDGLSALALATGDALMARALDGREPRVRLGDLVASGALELSDGYRTKRIEHGEPGLRILRAGDVRGHQIDPAGSDFVSSSFTQQMGRKVSLPGDIILTTKGTVGRVAVVPSEMEQVVYSPQICYFRVSDVEQVDPAFLAGWFRGPDLVRQTSTVMHKSDMAPYISLSDIRALEVPLPRTDRQREIGAAQRAILDLFGSKVKESRLLAALRDTLLPQLMSGKIRVKDAERVVEGVV